MLCSEAHECCAIDATHDGIPDPKSTFFALAMDTAATQDARNAVTNAQRAHAQIVASDETSVATGVLPGTQITLCRRQLGARSRTSRSYFS